MTTINIKKEELKGMMIPFRYKDFLVVSKTFMGKEGLYGFNLSELFFIDYNDLPENFEIEFPDSLEDLQEFILSLEYILQKITLNKEIPIQEKTGASLEDIINPLVEIQATHRKRLFEIERLKNEY